MKFEKWPLLSVILFFACGTFPLYLFPPGFPQPSHYLFALLSFGVVIGFRKILFRKEEGLLVVLLIWMVMRQTLYFFNGGELSQSFVPVVFFWFNLALYLSVSLYFRVRSVDAGKAMYRGIICALLISLALLLAFGLNLGTQSGPAAGGRDIAGFNNPNQLGYFAIACAGILVFFRLLRRVPGGWFALLFSLCVLIAVASLSKAAMIAITVYFFAFFRSIKGALFVLLVLLVLGGALYQIGPENVAALDRLATIGQSPDDNLISRGYGPLLAPDVRLIFGWGEGYVNSQIGHETHSTLGNVFISYGVVGFVVFVGFLSLIFRRLVANFGLVAALALCAPYVLYGLTHNGFRFSVVWVMLALFSSAPLMGLSGSLRATERQGLSI